MPNKIIIVRHGETEYNSKKILQGHLDIPLNETGLEQARQAAEALKKEKIDVFFSSDLSRALTTAKLSHAHHGTPFHVTKLLREKYFGRLQGLTFDQVGEFFSKFGEQGNYSFKGREKEFGVETEEEVLARIAEFKKIIAAHQGKTIAVFSHGGFIRRFLAAFGIKGVETMSIPNAMPMVLIKKGSTYFLEE